MIKFNPDLVDDLAREKAVLFLGAGVSASAQTASGGKIADWQTFLRSIAQEAPPALRDQVLEVLKVKDYLLAGKILQSSLADSWEGHISDHFGQRATPSRLHRAILGLKQRIILTTNFDKLLEVACDEASGTHYPVVISRVEENVFRALKDHSKSYIIKIHGTVDDISTLVFSRSEYIKLAFGNAYYAVFLENLLLNYTFMFIGFSMEDPAIMSLMEMYTLRFPKARPHYIFAPEPIAQNIIEINKRLRRLIYVGYDAANEHTKLPILIEELAVQAIARRREIFANVIQL